MVTCNSAGYLDLCLDSIRRNTSYPNYEVIVIDNHSTDATADLLRKHAADSRIRVHLLDSNPGFAAASNLAALEASGEYLILLNADTLVTSGWIGRLLGHLRADTGLGQVSQRDQRSLSQSSPDGRVAIALARNMV